MSVSTPALRAGAGVNRAWLRSRDWDLTFITMSVVLVVTPYLTYLGLTQLETLLGPLASTLGTTVDDLSRNIVNGTVALLIGGPHMYATFTRTALDKDFQKKYPAFLWSSLIIPVIVIVLALSSLQLLLTIFFFWASIHVLHQIIYITELYNHKQKTSLTKFSRLSDYAVILTALYPLAAWKMSINDFAIGLNNLSDVVGQVLGFFGLGLGPWMWIFAGSLFGVALAVWIGKTIIEWRQGALHGPKTLFIALTVTASFFVPALGNLDTAFQGMNVWHSLQYLMLTWMLNNVREKRGDLDHTPMIQQISKEGTNRKFYLLHIAATLGNIALAGVIFLILLQVTGSFDYSLDRSYYIAILSVLWVHYYHDHFLFTQPEVIET